MVEVWTLATPSGKTVALIEKFYDENYAEFHGESLEFFIQRIVDIFVF